MSILNVNQIQPVGSGQTITISASDITASSATITASNFTGNLTGNVTGNLTGNVTGNVTSSSTSTFSSGLNVTSGSVGIGTDNPDAKLTVYGTNAEDIIHISTGNNAGDTFANIRGDNESGIRIRGGGSYDGGTIELAGGLRDTDPGIIKFSTGTGVSPSERLRITSDGKVSIGGFNPSVAGLSISNSSTNRGLEFDTGSGFDSTSCIRAYDRPTTAYKSLGLTGSDIKFGINDVKKVSITSGGNVEIANGNLVFSTSGTGIDFSAASGSAAGSTSALLDDYEEGTWTPVAGNVTVNSGTPTYSGNYTKIGNIVHANMTQSGGNISFGSGSNFSGLPFTTSDKESGWYFCTASGKKGVANNFNGTLYVYSDEGQTPSNISALKISLVYRVT